MKRLLVFIFAAGFLAFVTSIEEWESADPGLNTMTIDGEGEEIPRVCGIRDVAAYIEEFDGCLDYKKLAGSAAHVENVAVRILEHSRRCLEKCTKKCRPNLDGFRHIIGRVFSQIKDYCHHYMEFKDREVHDLPCIQRGLSVTTYAGCFKEAFAAASKKKFRKSVESAISCTNEFQEQCSKAAKTIVNSMVRTILAVKQAEREITEDDNEWTTQSGYQQSGEIFRVASRFRLSNHSGAPGKEGTESATDQTTESGSRNSVHQVRTRVETEDGKSTTERVVTEDQTTESGSRNSSETPQVRTRVETEDGKSTTERIVTEGQTTESGSRNSVHQVRTRVETEDGKSTTERVVTEDGTNRNAQSSQASRIIYHHPVRDRSRESRPKPVAAEVKPEPPKRWYDYILQPFVSVWRAVRSFFGF